MLLDARQRVSVNAKTMGSTSPCPCRPPLQATRSEAGRNLSKRSSANFEDSALSSVRLCVDWGWTGCQQLYWAVEHQLHLDA